MLDRLVTGAVAILIDLIDHHLCKQGQTASRTLASKRAQAKREIEKKKAVQTADQQSAAIKPSTPSRLEIVVVQQQKIIAHRAEMATR